MKRTSVPSSTWGVGRNLSSRQKLGADGMNCGWAWANTVANIITANAKPDASRLATARRKHVLGVDDALARSCLFMHRPLVNISAHLTADAGRPGGRAAGRPGGSRDKDSYGESKISSDAFEGQGRGGAGEGIGAGRDGGRSTPVPRAWPGVADILVQRGLVGLSTLATARHLAIERDATISDVLLGNGMVRPDDLARAGAEARGLPYHDLNIALPPHYLLTAREIGDYIAEGVIPIGEGPHGPEFAAAGHDLSPAPLHGRLRQTYTGAQSPAALTTRHGLHATLVKRFPRALSEAAALGLERHAPHLSARRRLTLSQAVFMGPGLIALLAALVFALQPTLVFINLALAAVFTSVIGLKALSLLSSPLPRDNRATPNRIADRDLPVYTILVPLYREANVIAGLTEALRALDYPPEKLDIKLIFEADDQATLAAARALDLPGTFELIVAPSSEPKTKPKALNFALPFIRGAFTVIYDAEDRPEPGQLRTALDVFSRGGPEIACVQARLGFYNAGENWLTRQFEIEYAALFDLMLPMLQRRGWPIPLGGTSNHFRGIR